MNTLYYAKSTGGFYASDINGNTIPKDAVEITADEHAALLAGQSAGKLITADKNGHPILIDPPPPSIEMLSTEKRGKRNALLNGTDWFIMRHRDEVDVGSKASLTNGQFNALLAYRQALRDVPQQSCFPDKIDWPEAPSNT
jgi:hypothetical protein